MNIGDRVRIKKDAYLSNSWLNGMTGEIVSSGPKMKDPSGHDTLHLVKLDKRVRLAYIGERNLEKE
jgi:hypothetical protein